MGVPWGHGGSPGLWRCLVGDFLLTVRASKQTRIDGDDDLSANQHARPLGEVESENKSQSQGMNAGNSGSVAGVMPPPPALLGSGMFVTVGQKACFSCFLFAWKPLSDPEMHPQLTLIGTDSKRRRLEKVANVLVLRGILHGAV